MLRNLFIRNLPTVKKTVPAHKCIAPTSTPEVNAQSLRNVLSGIREMRKQCPKR